MISENIFKPKSMRKYITESQCDFLKDFSIGTLFPCEDDEKVQVVPAGQAHYDSFSSDELCGDVNKIGSPVEEFVLCLKKCKQIFIECGICKKEGNDECCHSPFTLILDVPVCRDGSVNSRAKLTAPWPLKLKTSNFNPLVEGVFTNYTLPVNLLFGPYEGVYRQEKKSFPADFSKNSWPGLKNILTNFIDTSDTSLSNWLPYVTFTPRRELANLCPFLFKNCVFYRTCQTISKNCELLVWTGEDPKLNESSNNGVGTSNLQSSSLSEFDYECQWCNFVFVNADYLAEHKERCSLAKDFDQIKDKFARDIIVPESTFTNPSTESDKSSLRRSKRRSVKSVKYSDSPHQSPESSVQKRNSKSEGNKPRERNHLCMYCKKYFTSLYTLRRHVESHSLEADFICIHCGLVCVDGNVLKRHTATSHEMQSKNMGYSDDRSSFSLNLRGDKSPVVVEKDYTYHLGNETCIFDLSWVKLLLKMNKNLRKTNSSALHCSSCNTQFYSHFAATLHERNCMEGVKPYKCGHCGKRFQLYFSIVRHMSNHIDIESQILVNVGGEYVPLLKENGTIDFRGLRNDENRDTQLNINSESQASSICLESEIHHNSPLGETKDYEPYNMTSIKTEDEENAAFKDALNSCFETLQADKDNSSSNYVGSCISTKNSNMEDFMSKLEITESAYGGRHRRHECNICGQRFYRRKHIKKHVELHESETSRVYKCSFCMLWFGSEEVVRFHEEQKHAYESKPFVDDNLNGWGRSLLKRLLSLLARESQKGRYCEYFNAKETLKDKRFECEICAKKFTSFYRVRKHKIIAHNELMDLFEAINEASDLPLDHVAESNMLSALANIKEEKVMEKLMEIKSDNPIDLHDSENESLIPSSGEINEEENINVLNANNFNVAVGLGKQGKELEEKDIIIEIDTELPNGDSVESDKMYKLLVGKGINGNPTLGISSPPQENCSNEESKIRSFTRKENTPTNQGTTAETECSIEKLSEKENNMNVVNQNELHIEPNMKKCKVCGKKLSIKTSMKTHMRSHTGERRYECMYCHNRYALLSTLKRHVRIHTNDRPFKCDVCQKAYTQSSNLKRHYRQHTGERPFQCTLCPKTYAEKFSLNRHLKSHKDVKAFKCKLCLKGFSEQHHLVRHYQMLHGSS